MKLYVYQIDDRRYDAGLGREECAKRGRIVEEWPLNSPRDARFLASHGTSYYGAGAKVSRIADLVHDLMVTDVTYRPSDTMVEWGSAKPFSVGWHKTEPKTSLLQRIWSWCFDR